MKQSPTSSPASAQAPDPQPGAAKRTTTARRASAAPHASPGSRAGSGSASGTRTRGTGGTGGTSGTRAAAGARGSGTTRGTSARGTSARGASARGASARGTSPRAAARSRSAGKPPSKPAAKPASRADRRRAAEVSRVLGQDLGGAGNGAGPNGAAGDTRLPSGAPEGVRRTVLLARSASTGLESARTRLSPAERQVRGKAARAQVPRESHAGWDPPPGRPDPVDLLESQAASRLPDLVPVRYGRMMESPFSYFRGAALPMANDLARTPSCGLIVQACGDAHLSNFGLFGSPERKLLFDVNDFDETLPAPWEWDVKRLAASLEVAARDNGYPAKDRRKILLAAVEQYRQAMRSFAKLGNLDVWYTHVDIEELRQQAAGQLRARQRKAVDKGLAKARTRDSMQELRKLTRKEDGRPRIVPDPPVIIPVRDLISGHLETGEFEAQLRGLIGKYRRTLQPDRRVLLEQYEFTDMARKVVGVGSVGTRCWIILLLGRDAGDPLFLQVKEAQESVLSAYAGTSKYANQGERVVNGQRLMQASSDIFLGWQRVSGLDGLTRDFYIRQLRDWKFSMDVASLIPRGMRMYGRLCGYTLARAHARSGDEIAIAAYLGGSDAFDQAIADFAAAYADQNERDYEAFTAAIAAERIRAERGV